MSRLATWLPVLVPGTAILIGLVVRCDLRLDSGLWEDEIIAATHAVQPFPDVLVDIFRNDIHPPLYFLQLHLWALVSHGDRWLLGNSLLWGALAIGSMWASLRREGQAAVALPAAAFLAVLPAGLWMSQELRPYAWISVLLIWALHFARRGFGAERLQMPSVLATFAFCLAILYSHAIGFLAPFCMGVYTAALLWRRSAAARDYGVWLACYGVLAVAALPVLASNLLHDANLADPGSLFGPLAAVITAGGRAQASTAGLVVYVGLLAAGLATARTRLMTACFILLPMLLVLLLGVAVKPIFKANFFSTLLVPFVALVLAELVLEVRGRWRLPVMTALLAGIGLLAVQAWPGRTVGGYRAMAALIRTQAQPGDVVYVPQLSMFWGMAWYLDGPDWGSPLAIANPPSPQWQAMYRRIGPRAVALLHLAPTGQTVTAPGGMTLLVGNDSLAQAAQGRRVWLVTNQRVDLPQDLRAPDAIGPLHQAWQTKVANLDLSLFH